MRRFIRVSFVLLSLFCAAQALHAQEPGRTPSESGSGFELEQNYPNPFNPETTIPFNLGPGVLQDGRPAVVTLRIVNLLQQLVAYPVALGHPSGEGIAVRSLEYTQPGHYEAFWDGTDLQGRQVASGIYFMQLTVNGRSDFKRMYVLK